jgi:inosine/xanthosine triphosphatase
VKIVVGSTSPHKLAAVRQACDVIEIAAEISGVEVVSAVSAQPFGLDEIVYGAKGRSAIESSGLVIGIESGIVSAGTTYFDLAAVVLRDHGEIVGTSLTTGIVIPYDFVRESWATMPRRTVGSVMRELAGSDPTDGASYLTKGRYSRVDQIAAGVIAAFAQARIP